MYAFKVHEKANEKEILLYNREKKTLETEDVFERRFMEFFYGTLPGRLIARAILSNRICSTLYGWLKNRSATKRDILSFIEKYTIDTSELDRPIEAYSSYNDFFKRRLKPGARPVDMEPSSLISPADGRLRVLDIKGDLVVPVKGCSFTINELVGRKVSASPWIGGTCVVVRLAPQDYHRFCYIDSGRHAPVVHVDGRLHSVSPLALRHNLKVFQGNDREFVVLETQNFGRVLHMDVGALTVGRIHQHQRAGGRFSKGQEKGYFELGGSTIILLFEMGKVQMDHDIIDYSRRGIETLVRYGSRIGTSVWN